jgi:hypothetical protein
MSLILTKDLLIFCRKLSFSGHAKVLRVHKGFRRIGRRLYNKAIIIFSTTFSVLGGKEPRWQQQDDEQ